MRALLVILFIGLVGTSVVCAQTPVPAAPAKQPIVGPRVAAPSELPEVTEIVSGPKPIEPVVGIGAVVGVHHDEAVILSVVDDGPASKAVLRADDKIVQIDDKKVVDLKTDGSLDLAKVVALIRGKAGTVVHVTVTREGAAPPVTYAITRAPVQLRVVDPAAPQ